MSSRVSPFASLTVEENQIRWLEYQSVTLPYVQGSVEPAAENREPPAPKQTEKRPLTGADMQPQPRKAAPKEPESAPNRPAPSPADFQKIRHSQYDAVIARMKQAEKSAQAYQTMG